MIMWRGTDDGIEKKTLFFILTVIPLTTSMTLDEWERGSGVRERGNEILCKDGDEADQSLTWTINRVSVERGLA